MRNTFFLLLLLSFPAFIFAQTHHESIFFADDSYALTVGAKGTLKYLFEEKPIEELTLYGHTDSRGTEAYNLVLAEKRAMAVLAYLQTIGLDTSTVKWAYYGERIPVSDNFSEEGRAQNRRVEIWWTYGDLPPIAMQIATPEVNAPPQDDEVQLDHSYLYQTLRSQLEVQHFEINPQRDTFIVTRDSMIFEFEAHSFAMMEHACKEQVAIDIIEYNTLSDALLGNMQTLSDGRLIHSIGMYNAFATCEGKKVTLKKDKSFKVYVPYDPNNVNIRDVMGFYGERNKTSGEMNWVNPRMLSAQKGYNGFLDSGDYDPLEEEEHKCRFWKGVGVAVAGITHAIMGRNRRYDGKARREQKAKLRKFAQENKGKKLDSLTGAEKAEMTYYVFHSKKFAPANCDIFWKKKRSSFVNFRVKHKATNHATIKLAFKRLRSMISPTKVTAAYTEFNVPRGEAVWVVGMEISSNDLPRLGLKEVITRSGETSISFKETENLNAFVRKLKRIN